MSLRPQWTFPLSCSNLAVTVTACDKLSTVAVKYSQQCWLYHVFSSHWTPTFCHHCLYTPIPSQHTPGLLALTAWRLLNLRQVVVQLTILWTSSALPVYCLLMCVFAFCAEMPLKYRQFVSDMQPPICPCFVCVHVDVCVCTVHACIYTLTWSQSENPRGG